MKTIRLFGFEIRVRRLGRVEAAVVAGAKDIDEEKVRMVFAKPESDPTWQVWRTLLQRSIDACADNAIAQHVASDHGLLAHSAGGVAALRQFLDGVQSIREEALRDTE